MSKRNHKGQYTASTPAGEYEAGQDVFCGPCWTEEGQVFHRSHRVDGINYCQRHYRMAYPR